MDAGSVGRGSLDRQSESGYGNSRQRGFHADHHRNELHRRLKRNLGHNRAGYHL